MQYRNRFQWVNSFALSVALLCIALVSAGQVLVTGHSFTPFSAAPRRVFDLSVTNPLPEARSIKIKATLRLQGGEAVLSAESAPFEVAPGFQRINSASILESLSIADNAYGSYMNGTSRLLEGTYELCYEVFTLGGELPTNQCYPLIATNSTFLHLVSPSDRSVVNVTNPALTWTHSGIVPSSDPRETFTLTLVEMLDGQKASQAIAENSPHLLIPKLTSHAILYPLNTPRLEAGKQYAWQVIHLYDGYLVQASDVWTFRLEDWEDPRDVKYVDISASKGHEIVDVYESFYFRYDESYNSTDLKIAIINSQGEAIKPEPQNDDPAASSLQSNGFNGYRLRLSPYNLKAGDYIIRISDAKGKLFSVQIKYHR